MVTLEKARHETVVFSMDTTYPAHNGMASVTVWPTLGLARKQARKVSEAANGLNAIVRREY
jgi:predicted TIM-barrel fold metal-dependent hydrolase